MKYNYTAIFTPKENGSGFYCRVPDLPGCISSGKDIADAIEMITDAASIWLVGAEDDGDPIPTPSSQDDILRETGSLLSVISVDTIKYRSQIDTHSVRKNVSLPAWMSALADKRRVNCSQVLQESLMKIFESA